MTADIPEELKLTDKPHGALALATVAVRQIYTVEPLITHTPSVDRRMYGLWGAMACGKVLKIDTKKSPNYAAIY